MLRSTLEKLYKENLILECEKPVDPVYEMGGVLKHFNNKVPILFKNIKGHKMSSIGGLYGDRYLLYHLLSLNDKNRIEAFMKAIANPKDYEVYETGPVKENIIRSNIDLGKLLPINKFQEKDSSSFITAGVMVVKDPETKNYYTSIRRLQYNGGNKLSALIASPKLTRDFLHEESLGKDLEVAIVLGYDAEFLMASQMSSSLYGVDKYKIDSSLRGEALKLVRCESVDLLVPRDAEIVLEGRIVAHKRQPEGPFGELMGYYGEEKDHPIIEIDLVSHRDNPIYQTAFPCREEHVSNGLIREMELYYHLKNQVNVLDVHVTEGGGYRFNAFISIKKENEGDGGTAILAALGLNKDLKNVVIVDDDVDIYDLQEIEWAILTRSQAERDYRIIPACLGSSLEPSHSIRGKTDKVGIDATKPIYDPDENFERAVIPNYEEINISKYFPNLK